MLITYLPRAELSPHRPQQTFPCTYKHTYGHTHQQAHSLAHIHTYNGCHCSSSTHLLNTGTFTIETSEDRVDKLVGIPLTKAPVKTVCRLMIDYIYHSAGRAEHGTSYATPLNSHLLKEIDSKADKILYWSDVSFSDITCVKNHFLSCKKYQKRYLLLPRMPAPLACWIGWK